MYASPVSRTGRDTLSGRSGFFHCDGHRSKRSHYERPSHQHDTPGLSVVLSFRLPEVHRRLLRSELELLPSQTHLQLSAGRSPRGDSDPGKHDGTRDGCEDVPQAVAEAAQQAGVLVNEPCGESQREETEAE